MRSTAFLGVSPDVAVQNKVPQLVSLTIGLSRPFEVRWSTAFSFCASLLQAINVVMCLALFPQVVSHAPQHFRHFDVLATCGFFVVVVVVVVATRLSARSFNSFDSSLPTTVHC